MQRYILGLLILLGLATVQARPQSDDGDEGNDKLAEFVQNNPDYAEGLLQLGVDQDAVDAISEAAENKTPLDPTVAQDILDKLDSVEDEGELVGRWRGWSILKEVVKKAAKEVAKEAAKEAAKKALESLG